MPSYKHLFILLLLVFSAVSATAKTSKENCLNVDYRKRFGPIRDQNSHGYCWAFAGAALAEEAACLKDPSLCGTSLSPIDASRCETNFGAAYEKSVFGRPYDGGTITEALNCVLKDGICKEDEAAYLAVGTSHGYCYARRWLTGRSCIPMTYLKLTYLEIERASACNPSNGRHPSTHITSLIKSVDEVLQHTMPDHKIPKEELQQAALRASDWPSFLRELLIPRQCIENRQTFSSETTVYTELFPENYKDVVQKYYPENGELLIKKSNEPIAQRMMNRLGRGRSLGIGVCVSKDPPECVDRHALVVNGSRWNEEKKRCEIHLKNSWGIGAPFSGWHDVDEISKYTVLIDQLQ